MGERSQSERQPVRDPDRARPRTDPVTAGNGHARLGRQLQSTMGNRAAASVLQRDIDIALLVDTEDKRREVTDAGFTVPELQRIHDDLKNKGTVAEHLRALEASVAEKFTAKESALKYTRALDAALFALESTWTGLPADAVKAARRTVIPKAKDPLPTVTFLGEVQKGLPLKDVGAPISHGEHAHRIQWYVIARMLGDAVRTARLYRLLGSASFIVDLKPLAVEKKEQAEQEVKEEQGPAQQQAAPGYRAYFRDRVLLDLYLWNAILDIPFSASGPETAVGDVGYAAPVTLTKEIAGGQGGMGFSQVQQAILNRKLKRFYANRAAGDAELRRQLDGIRGRPKDLHDRATALARRPEPTVIDYHARRVLAFAIAGIPQPDEWVQNKLDRYPLV